MRPMICCGKNHTARTIMSWIEGLTFCPFCSVHLIFNISTHLVRCQYVKEQEHFLHQYITVHTFHPLRVTKRASLTLHLFNVSALCCRLYKRFVSNWLRCRGVSAYAVLLISVLHIQPSFDKLPSNFLEP